MAVVLRDRPESVVVQALPADELAAHAVGPWQPSSMADLIAETIGHVRLLRLDRPERKNAITSSLGWGIVRAVAAAHADDDVRVVALTGNGDAFCSGLDLGGGDGSAPDTGLSEQEQMLDEKGWVGRFLLALRFETDKPVVAGINGVAVGAGLSLAMAADIRIAADTARLHPGYLRAGTSPDGGLTWSLPTLVGHEAAMRFLLESRFVDADEALRRGLVSEVVAADQLEARLLGFCEAIAAQAPLAVRRTKRLVARTPLVTDVEARVTDEIRQRRRGPRQRGRPGGGSGDHGEARARVPRALTWPLAPRSRRSRSTGSSACCHTNAVVTRGWAGTRLVRAGGVRGHRTRRHGRRGVSATPRKGAGSTRSTRTSCDPSRAGRRSAFAARW